jgi:hypothetical protein
VLADRIATARRIIQAQQVLLERLRTNGHPTFEAEAALRTYASSLAHLLAHAGKNEGGSARAQSFKIESIGALTFCLSMIFSENRLPLFRPRRVRPRKSTELGFAWRPPISPPRLGDIEGQRSVMKFLPAEVWDQLA